VLELKLPQAEVLAAGGLWPALASRWPSYIGYALSFMVIRVMWASHRALFEYIRRADRSVLLANLLLLMGVSFLPFPTAVLADHLADPATRTSATVFYGATLIFTSLSFNLPWHVGRRGAHLLGREISHQGLRTITRRYAIAVGLYAGATGLAFVNVWRALRFTCCLPSGTDSPNARDAVARGHHAIAGEPLPGKAAAAPRAVRR
jgi:uncharacterized membrane protein